MNWFKKNWFKVLFNLIIIFLIFIVAEYIIYKTPDKKAKFKIVDKHPFIMLNSYVYNDLPTTEQYFKDMNHEFYKTEYNTDKIPAHISIISYREPFGLNYKNKPILLFGCSYGWGRDLDDTQTFQYKLSQLTKRPVYNRSITGWGVQHMLYHLRHKDFYSTLPKPQYVIYVYCADHISRMHKYAYINRYRANYFFSYLKYNKRNNQLVEEKRPLWVPYSRIWNWYILPYFASVQEKNTKKSFELFRLHLLESRKEIDNHWGKDVKFIVFDFETNYNDYKDVLTDENIKILKQDRIEVIKTSDLTGINILAPRFTQADKHFHPNERVWDLLTPLFYEKMKTL